MGLLDCLFGKQIPEEHAEKIKKLEEKLMLKEQEVERLVSENDALKVQLQELDEEKIAPKQLEIFEKNVKENREKIVKLESILKGYGIPFKKEYFQYKVELDNFFSNSRFKEILTWLKEKKYVFLSDIILEDIREEILQKKNGEEAYRRLEDYTKGQYDWETSVFKNKGEKVAKIFGRSKKLNQFFSDYYFEYMDDLDRVDFSILETYGIKPDKIKEYEEQRDLYYKEYRK